MSAQPNIERLAADDPEEYYRLVRGYHALLGNGDVPNDDIRIAAVPATDHLDKRRYSLGLSGITAAMKPLRPGEFIVVGAREGNGKSAAGEQLTLDNSLHYRVLHATLEQTREEIRDRMLAKLMRCSQDVVHDERDRDTEQYCAAYADLMERDLLLWHPARKKDRTAKAIMDRACKVSANILVIDYSRELSGWKPGSDGPSEIVEELADFARDTKITVVLLSQLNRDAALRRPHNGYLQDTGRLEQKATRVVLLWRPFLGNPRKDRVCEIIISKNRWGPMFRGHAHWIGESMGFFDMTMEEEALQTCCRKATTQSD